MTNDQRGSVNFCFQCLHCLDFKRNSVHNKIGLVTTKVFAELLMQFKRIFQHEKGSIPVTSNLGEKVFANRYLTKILSKQNHTGGHNQRKLITILPIMAKVPWRETVFGSSQIDTAPHLAT